MIKARIIQRPDMAAIMKQVNFGTSVGVNKTLKEGQAASIGAAKTTFTIRNNWLERSPIAIKAKFSNKNQTRISGEIFTKADFLRRHEDGTDKTARGGGNVAVPTENVRRNKRLIIPKGQRPKGLGPKVFVMQTRRGPVLAQRITKGRNKGIKVLYGLEKQVAIKKQSTFEDPIRKVVKSNLKPNIAAGIRFAMATRR